MAGYVVESGTSVGTYDQKFHGPTKPFPVKLCTVKYTVLTNLYQVLHLEKYYNYTPLGHKV